MDIFSGPTFLKKVTLPLPVAQLSKLLREGWKFVEFCLVRSCSREILCVQPQPLWVHVCNCILVSNIQPTLSFYRRLLPHQRKHIKMGGTQEGYTGRSWRKGNYMHPWIINKIFNKWKYVWNNSKYKKHSHLWLYPISWWRLIAKAIKHSKCCSDKRKKLLPRFWRV